MSNRQDDNPMQMNAKATEIAQKYNLLYDDVVQWFDKGYAVNEIERAYKMGEDMDAEVSDILAMRDVGMDWREIGKALDITLDQDDDEDESSYGDLPSAKRKRKDGRR